MSVSDDYSWRRACSSATNCVEVGWRKASASMQNGNCIEVAGAMVTVAMRDSADPDGPVLRFPRGAWREFVEGVKAGDFDR